MTDGSAALTAAAMAALGGTALGPQWHFAQDVVSKAQQTGLLRRAVKFLTLAGLVSMVVYSMLGRFFHHSPRLRMWAIRNLAKVAPLVKALPGVCHPPPQLPPLAASPRRISSPAPLAAAALWRFCNVDESNSKCEACTPLTQSAVA